MAINSQQLNIVVLVLAVIVVLFACISEGTYGWSIYEAKFSAGGTCDIDSTIGIGLYKSLSTTDYSSGCGVSDDTSTDNVSCDGLNDDQCTWLKNARAGSGIAVAFSVIMLSAHSAYFEPCRPQWQCWCLSHCVYYRCFVWTRDRSVYKVGLSATIRSSKSDEIK